MNYCKFYTWEQTSVKFEQVSFQENTNEKLQSKNTMQNFITITLPQLECEQNENSIEIKYDGQSFAKMGFSSAYKRSGSWIKHLTYRSEWQICDKCVQLT